MTPPMDLGWVVWSDEHDAWWGPNRSGYFTNLLAAGLYTEVEARHIQEAGNAPSVQRNELAMPLTQAIHKVQTRAGFTVKDLLLQYFL